MKDLNALARFIIYIIAALAGAAVIVVGVVKGDLELVAIGGGLLGTNTLAGLNVKPASVFDAES